jgi:hypothetical protein
MASESVILFPSTNYAIWADRELAKAEIPHKLAPIPRNLSSSCGYCIRIGSSLSDSVSELFRERGIEIEGIVEITG